ncbi:unnamed protein product [Didymodactylos carnosus]|uniref:Tartrate-resistant acid phosphatase type 5 n=1 Tax=Didymodactylos carnosus TaxID=1234261 RepID=A0A814AEV7_9BILA|nr:unnamed protein product [Didymodactylos carnosus]CAF0912622.1 unnamed protein product [Didymodactylos carnosus]CAF3574263.1 unnamed protein product [Didymodactylos carnosus]CAF3693399.1 unnamed protein product [Didymodactylos carnosus]
MQHFSTTAYDKLRRRYDVLANKNDDGNTRFFVIGDWGGLPFAPYKTPSEVAVAAAMGNLGKTLNTSFQLALGDNFYFDGVQSVTDPRFQHTFEQVFSAASLQTPWYVLAGNHDHKGNVSAQIEYGKISRRCLWQSDKQTKLVDFVMLDTVILCGGGNLSDWEHTPLKGPASDHVAEAYWQWVEEQFRQSTAPYLIVSGHFPVYSVAEHGPTKCLVDRLRPLLHQYRATAYLCGHDHSLQHLADDLDGTHMNYFVVGAGNIVENNHNHAKDVPADSLKYYWGGAILLGGFGLIEANNTQMTFSFIEHSEKTLYQTVMKPRF